MIFAKFVKAEPTRDGITFILKAQKTKANMRLAVDLMDEECIIELVKHKEQEPLMNDLMNQLESLIEDWAINKLGFKPADRLSFPECPVCDEENKPVTSERAVESELKELREEPLFQLPAKGESEE